jgi:predicted transcriptional regulator
MATTIQISDKIKMILDRKKMIERETYNDVIERMIEDEIEINKATKKEIEEAKSRVDSGNFISQEEVKKRFRL